MAVPDSNKSITIHSDRIMKIHNGDGMAVALVGRCEVELAKANAMLIAAAPDLLEALVDICEFCDDPNGPAQRETLAEGLARMLVKARSAIVKAREQ